MEQEKEEPSNFDEWVESQDEIKFLSSPEYELCFKIHIWAVNNEQNRIISEINKQLTTAAFGQYREDILKIVKGG